MYRGTTPTLIFDVHSELDLSTIEEIWITFKSGSRMKTYEIDDVVIDSDENTISLPWGQEDTLYFGSGYVACQMRIKTTDGNAYASSVKKLAINSILKDGVI